MVFYILSSGNGIHGSSNNMFFWELLKALLAWDLLVPSLIGLGVLIICSIIKTIIKFKEDEDEDK